VDGMLRLCEMAPWVSSVLEGNRPVSVVAFSPDSRCVFSGTITAGRRRKLL